MATYQLRVNGKTSTVDSWDPDQPLLYILRNTLGLHGAKYGCGLGQCGACTVLIDGKAARACITPVKQVAGRGITTLEQVKSGMAGNLCRCGTHTRILSAVMRAAKQQGGRQ